MNIIARNTIRRSLVCALFTVITLLGVLLSSSRTVADNKRLAVKIMFDDMMIVGLNPPEGTTYDFPIVSPREGVARVIEAMALIREKSPYSRVRIEDLKREGRVLIIYDPHLPDRSTNMSSIMAAIFLPKYENQEDPESSSKDFVVVVSRFGVKWPLEELAPVLIHELVGHGVQHLEDRLETMRLIDVECEAWLYTEMAHQELGAENFTDERIDMRKNLKLQCDDFFRYLRENDTAGYAVWDVLNPDIPRLLTHFDGYLNELRRQGVMSETLATAADQDAETLEEIFRNGTPEVQFDIAQNLLRGMPVKQDLVEAMRWHRRAAENGHAEAQRIVADSFALAGPDRDLIQAAAWYEKSAVQGNAKAQYTFGMFFVNGTGNKPQDPVEAARWYAKAALQGHGKAQYRLGYAFETGSGVDVNFATAAKWYGLAAENVAQARFRLGVLYETGRGVDQDLEEAADQYRRAIEQGSEVAAKRLVILEQAHPEVMQ